MIRKTTTYVRVSGQLVSGHFGTKNCFFYETPATLREVVNDPNVKQEFTAVTNAVLVTRVTEETEQPLL